MYEACLHWETYSRSLACLSPYSVIVAGGQDHVAKSLGKDRNFVLFSLQIVVSKGSLTGLLGPLIEVRVWKA